MAQQGVLTGKTAIVTGGSSGIGRAISIQLCQAGATVYLAGRTAAAVKEAVAAAGEAGGHASGVTVDLRSPRELQALVDRASNDTGRLDVMVNNAGVEYPSSIIDGDPERWREMLEVNVLALLAGSQAAIKAMRACKAQGHIVNISSVAGRREGSGVYGATKWAVNAIATSLRNELQNDTIRVVNILPGAVATNFARNFPPAVVQGIAKAVGVDAEFEPGGHLPTQLLEQVAQAGKQILANADDIARAVMFAIKQPIELNVFEMVVRPQRDLPLQL
ncbi:MAG TPA: SDR family oxidoreductase [Candidatus Binataceae bacterium]|nr:SDR family oxidoreductase [Candidatus Binataceae bacterium]